MNLKRTVYLLAVVLFAFLLNSCSFTVQKRLYRKGYHVQTYKNHRQNRKGSDVHTPVTTIDPTVKEVPVTPVNEEEVLLETTAEQHTTDLTQRKGLNKRKVIECDRINMKNGQVLEVRGVSITNGEVRYYLCNDPNSPLYIINSNEVTSITYANGSTVNMGGGNNSSGNNTNNNNNSNSNANNNNNNNNTVTITTTRYNNSSTTTYQNTDPKRDTGAGFNIVSVVSGGVAILFMVIALYLILFGLSAWLAFAIIAMTLAILAIVMGILGLGRKAQGAGIAGMAMGGAVLIIAIITIILFFI